MVRIFQKSVYRYFRSFFFFLLLEITPSKIILRDRNFEKFRPFSNRLGNVQNFRIFNFFFFFLAFESPSSAQCRHFREQRAIIAFKFNVKRSYRTPSKTGGTRTTKPRPTLLLFPRSLPIECVGYTTAEVRREVIVSEEKKKSRDKRDEISARVNGPCSLLRIHNRHIDYYRLSSLLYNILYCILV